MGLVISDSSTMIHLAAIGRLGLLKRFFQQVTIPTAVWREGVEQGEDRLGVREVARARKDGWIRVIEPSGTALLQLLKRDLDDGEAEVIALTLEHKRALALLDEADAREIADLYDLAKTGVIGILIRANQEGIIELLRPELDKLLQQAGFWIAEKLYHQALESVGEMR